MDDEMHSDFSQCRMFKKRTHAAPMATKMMMRMKRMRLLTRPLVYRGACSVVYRLGLGGFWSANLIDPTTQNRIASYPIMFPAEAPMNRIPVVTFLFVSPAVFCPDHE